MYYQAQHESSTHVFNYAQQNKVCISIHTDILSGTSRIIYARFQLCIAE